MQLSDSPLKHPIPFGENGLRDPLLETTPVGDNAASYDAGFPAITMTIKEAGGVPPQGQDMNQILYELSALARWASAGVINQFDAEFAAAVGGYPQGARVVGDDGKTVYRCTQDNNSNDPNSDQTGWDSDQLSTGDIDGLDDALDGKLNKAGDTATGNLTAPKFIMNAAQGTGAGDAVRYDYLLGSIPKRSAALSGDLDSYTAQGFYQQGTDSPDPGGTLGYPVNLPGGLLVFANGEGVCQIYLTNPMNNGSQRRIYYRNYWTGNWGPWTTLYDTNFRPTPADIGASPEGHTHAPGDVGAAPIDHVHTAAQGNADIVAGGYGQVGTYVQAWNSDGQSVFIGNTKPGSVLIPATSGERREDGHFLSGTYKCSGHVFGGGNADDATTLWIRTDAASLFEQQLMLSELRWDNAEHDSATATVTFAGSGISLPFTAFKDDVEAHGRWLFAMIRDGEFGPIAEYIPPTQQEIAASENPALRQKEMAQATAEVLHWDMMGDTTQADAWRSYYREIYALTELPDWPISVPWPQSPA